MGMGRFGVSGTLAILLGTSSIELPLQANRLAPVLAQVIPNTITGQLDENSEILEDGRYFSVHTFEGQSGETIIIELLSEDFDTVLILIGPDGQIVGGNDNFDSSTNSRFTVTLPTTGTYIIAVSANTAGEVGTGLYTLTWNSANSADIAQSEALQRATELHNQAVELYRAGRYSEAEYLAQESLAILREQLGDRHPNVATSLNNLAELYRVQGRYGEAEPLLQLALTIDREQLGNRHPSVASNLSNLAVLYRDQGRYVEAESLLQLALAIDREHFGNRHPNVATNLNNLALLYRDQGRYVEAESLYEESLDIWREPRYRDKTWVQAER